MKKITFVLLAMGLTVGLMLTGCNTINGIGKDVEKLGEKVQDATKK